jgi:Fe-S-cluster containining protein
MTRTNQRINYTNPSLCAACGGKCCQRCPGAAFPEDFEPDVIAGVQAALETGQWAIDWWEGDPREGHDELARAYFVRPSVRGCTDVFDPSWGGPCVFLADDGCTLLADERPRGCRMLVPSQGDHCTTHESQQPKRDAALAWLPYREELEKIGLLVKARLKSKKNTQYRE